MQRRRQREAAEKHIDNRVGKARQRLLGAHFGNLKQDSKQRHDQRGYGNVHRFGKPHNRHKGQNAQPFIDIALVRQDLIERRAYRCRHQRNQQTAEIGNRRLRAQKLDIVRLALVRRGRSGMIHKSLLMVFLGWRGRHRICRPPLR